MSDKPNSGGPGASLEGTANPSGTTSSGASGTGADGRGAADAASAEFEAAFEQRFGRYGSDQVAELLRDMPRSRREPVENAILALEEGKGDVAGAMRIIEQAVADNTGGPFPTTPQALDSEIATIEQRMSRDRRGYFRDGKAQARYRELLRLRDSK